MSKGLYVVYWRTPATGQVECSAELPLDQAERLLDEKISAKKTAWLLPAEPAQPARPHPASTQEWTAEEILKREG